MALQTAQLMSTFEAKDRPTIAGCFDLLSKNGGSKQATAVKELIEKDPERFISSTLSA